MIAKYARWLSMAILIAALCSLIVRPDERPPADAQELLLQARAHFTRADADGDSKLTLAEFLTLYPAKEHADRKRQFAQFDRGGEGALSRSEFAGLFMPTDRRGAMRDPIVELEQAALAQLEALLHGVDPDGITLDDWPVEDIGQDIPALAQVTFDHWDRNADGMVNQAERRWLLKVAYGLTQLDGRPIRTPQGRVLSWYYFRAVDQNHDGVLSQREFLAHHDGGTNREKNAVTFAFYDNDADGQLTAEETSVLYWHDTLAEFFTYDRDSDGYLNAGEFLGIGWATEIARRSLRAFDDDGDGKVSYHEFRGTTFANQASDWGKVRRDADGDGLLSFEEFYQEKPPLLVAMSRYFFDRFDLDKNGFLSNEEFDFDADFGRGDTDRDGQLTLAEFLAVQPNADVADRTRRFLVFDFDGDGKLNLSEFHNVSSSVDERKNVPDPMAVFADAALAKWKAILASADRDRDGALSPAEWPAKQITKEIPALTEAPFQLWDHDRDGKVDRADARWLVDVAFGLKQLDGRPLRTSTGRMFAWYFFRRHDTNHDDLMSRNEFVACYHPPNVNTAELFEKLDADGDGELTQQETWPVFCHDTIAAFLDYDRNRDGYLTSDEVRSIGWGWMLARRTVPAFDDDGDGRLSFREFRLTNFANQASDWWQLKDLDGDSRVSWKEFYREKPPLLIGQSRFYFDRYDRNQDGFLSAFEFPSEANPNHRQILAYADMLERVLPLEIQFASHVCQLTDAEGASLGREAYTAIERLLEKSASQTASTQANLARPGVAVASSAPGPVRTGIEIGILRSPHLVLRRELAQVLRSQPKGVAAGGDSAATDTWQKLDAERLLAEKRRKKAAALEHVAMLDEALLLSAAQRQELCDLLESDASDGWWQPIDSVVILDWQSTPVLALLSGGGFYGVFTPEAELSRKLSASQIAALRELQQPQEQEAFYAERTLPADADAPAAPAGIANNARAARAVAIQRQSPRRFLRQGPSLEAQLRRLTIYIERRLEDVDRACELNPAIRPKLSLAAKLDLARLREQLSSLPPDKLNDGEELVVRTVNVRWPAPMPLEVFRGPDSQFEKSLQGRLLDRQKRKLADADAQRRVFQRQALVEAVVAGFERAAALTAAQCDALAALFGGAIANVEAESGDDWRYECLRRVAQLPFDRLQLLLFDFQQAGAQQQHTQLIENVRQIEAARGKAAKAAVPSA